MQWQQTKRQSGYPPQNQMLNEECGWAGRLQVQGSKFRTVVAYSHFQRAKQQTDGDHRQRPDGAGQD